MEKVLISGGTGLVGRYLGRKLLDNGFEVAVLSRQASIKAEPGIHVYYWDIDKGEIDQEALDSCDYIIHLAGVNIGERRWTEKRKQQIIESRVRSAELLLHSVQKQDHDLKAFISASAIGYYGSVTSDRVFDENDVNAEDFLGQTCKQWEQSADRFKDLGIRVVKIRTGIVLFEKGGAVSRLFNLARLGLGSAIGNGKQYLPWIHYEDLCNIYLMAIRNSKMQGAFNAVAPEHISNKEFIRKISEVLRRPFWLPGIPSGVIGILFGERAAILLNGSRVSPERIKSTGYTFRFSTVKSALHDLIK